jgi:hypothetical protein
MMRVAEKKKPAAGAAVGSESSASAVLLPAAAGAPPAECAPWAGHHPSELAHHGGECCTGARAWFLAMNHSMWRGQGGPAWIRRQWDWGPSRWPLHWCEAMEGEEIDCGAHAALAREAFRERGERAVPVQLVQRYETHNVPHWHHRWEEHGANPTWAGSGVVYHEACAVIRNGEVEVWNATAGAWASPENVSGYGSIVAVRIGGPVATGETVLWGGRRVPLGQWVPATGEDLGPA